MSNMDSGLKDKIIGKAKEVEGKLHTYYNYTALKRFLRQLKEDDIIFFSSYYKLDINKVRKSVEYVSKLNYD